MQYYSFKAAVSPSDELCALRTMIMDPLYRNRVPAAQTGTRFERHPLLPIIVVFLVLTYGTVALRIWTRKKYAKLGLDDLLCCFFFSIYCGATIGMFVPADGAAGIEEIPFESTALVMKLLLVSECFYILTMIFLKLTLAMFFLRILPSQWQRWLIIGAVSTSTLFGMAYFFFAIFQCGWFTEIDIFLLRMIAGKCLPKSVGMGMNFTYAALGTASDWTCGLVPVFVLRKSKMPRRAKVIVSALLLFASFRSIASIVRLFYLESITVPTGRFFTNSSKLAIWSTIEPGIGITVASLATLRPLIQKLFRRRRNSSNPSIQPSYETNAMTQDLREDSSPTLPRVLTGPSEVYGQKRTARLDSDATTAVGSVGVESRKGSAGAKSMTEEMRAYGMSDFEACATLNEDDHERDSDVEFGVIDIHGRGRLPGRR